MILHWFVKIHALEDRSIEAGKKFGRDDDYLERVHRVAEAVQDLALLIFRTPPGLVFVCFVAFSMHHNGGGILTAQQKVDLFLVSHAAGAVIDNNLSL